MVLCSKKGMKVVLVLDLQMLAKALALLLRGIPTIPDFDLGLNSTKAVLLWRIAKKRRVVEG